MHQHPQVVFLRHGESECNLKEQFTGWEDSGMTPKGFEQARKAGRYLKDHGFKFDMVFTSVLSRAIESAEIICEDSDNKGIPMEKAWQLNARHPGVLQGLTKEVAVGLYGKEKVNIWRGSYDIMPECVGLDDNRHPVNSPSLGRNKSMPQEITASLRNPMTKWLQTIQNQYTLGQNQFLHPSVPLGSTRLGNSCTSIVRFYRVLRSGLPTKIRLKGICRVRFPPHKAISIVHVYAYITLTLLYHHLSSARLMLNALVLHKVRFIHCLSEKLWKVQRYLARNWLNFMTWAAINNIPAAVATSGSGLDMTRF